MPLPEQKMPGSLCWRLGYCRTGPDTVRADPPAARSGGFGEYAGNILDYGYPGL